MGGDTQDPGPDPQPGKLTCRACGRTVGCPPADLTRFMRARDWPRCCGQVMSYFIPAGRWWEPPAGREALDGGRRGCVIRS